MRVLTAHNTLIMDSGCLSLVEVKWHGYGGGEYYQIETEIDNKTIVLSSQFLNVDKAELELGRFITALNNEAKSFSFNQS